MAAGARWLIPLILLFAVVTFARSEPLTVFLGVFFSLLLMSALAVTFLGGGWLHYGLLDHVLGFLELARSMITQPLSFRPEVSRELTKSRMDLGKPNPWPVFRGLLIALPVLVVFAALLGSADLVFGRELGAFLGLLKLEKLPEYVFRLFYVLLVAYALAGVYLHAALHRRDEYLIRGGKAPAARFLGFVEAAIVLASVVILFSAFFGGQANIAIQGYTYSEYARRGFGELMAVAFFSLLMVLGLGTITRRDTRLEQRVFSGLGVAILGLVSVILVSAFQRLSLYEMAYGFSRLRTYVHVLLMWTGLLLAAAVLLELLHRERAFAAAVLIASLGFAATLSALNVDAFIARQNVNRALPGQALDVPYLVSLSTDTVPALAEIFRSPSYSSSTRQAVGAILACREQLAGARRSGDWRSFTLSQWQAENALRDLQGPLAEYHFLNEKWPPSVLTPDGVSQDCQGYSQ
jgi:hypothetical protein